MSPRRWVPSVCAPIAALLALSAAASVRAQEGEVPPPQQVRPVPAPEGEGEARPHVVPVPAPGVEGGARAQANALIDQGLAEREEGNEQLAIRLFEQSLDLAELGRAHAEIGRSLRALERWNEAEEALIRALSAADPWVDSHRMSLRDDLRTVREHLGTVVVRGPEGMEISIDNRVRGRLPLEGLRVGEGQHRLVWRHDGEEGERRIEVRGGRSLMLDLNMNRVDPPVPNMEPSTFSSDTPISSPPVDDYYPAANYMVRIAYANALSVVTPGMQADRRPLNPPGSAADLEDAVLLPDERSDQAFGVETGCRLEDMSQYCVNAPDTTLAYAPAIRAELGYFLSDPSWLGFGALVRFAPLSGGGEMANFLIALRVYMRVLALAEGRTEGEATRPAEGAYLVAHVGAGAGQIQAAPLGYGEEQPFVVSGINGVQAGATFGYRIGDLVGLFGQAELMFQFPSFLFNIDLALGVEFVFS